MKHFVYKDEKCIYKIHKMINNDRYCICIDTISAI